MWSPKLPDLQNQMGEQMKIAERTGQVLRSLASEVIHSISRTAWALCQLAGQSLEESHIREATRIVLASNGRSELAKHGCREGQKSLKVYDINATSADVNASPAVTTTTSSTSTPVSTPAVNSLTNTAATSTPVESTALHGRLRGISWSLWCMAKGVMVSQDTAGPGNALMRAAAFLVGVEHYLLGELLDVGGEVADNHRRKILSPRHLQLAVRNDEELNILFSSFTWPGAGVVPSIHCNLVFCAKRWQERAADEYEDDLQEWQAFQEFKSAVVELWDPELDPERCPCTLTDERVAAMFYHHGEYCNYDFNDDFMCALISDGALFDTGSDDPRASPPEAPDELYNYWERPGYPDTPTHFMQVP